MEVSDMDLRLPYYMMYPIPYAFDEDKIQKRDREYLQSMYPATAKKIFPYIQEECDRQEYEGSMIYDEYPDRLSLFRIADTISTILEQEAECDGGVTKLVQNDLAVRIFGQRAQKLQEVAEKMKAAFL